jgi:anti-sigma factor RsiW
MIDERLELLITRKLDGELSSDESLELNRELIRNPHARAMFQDSARIDAESRTALQNAALASTPAAPDGIHTRDIAGWSRRTAGRWLAHGAATAIAAGISLAVLLGLRGPGLVETGRQAIPTGPPPSGSMAQQAVWPSGHAAPINGRRTGADQLDREVIGVFDEQSGSLYLLELDQLDSCVERVRRTF